MKSRLGRVVRVLRRMTDEDGSSYENFTIDGTEMTRKDWLHHLRELFITEIEMSMKEMSEYEKFIKQFMKFVDCAEGLSDHNRALHFDDVREQFIDVIGRGLR